MLRPAEGRYRLRVKLPGYALHEQPLAVAEGAHLAPGRRRRRRAPLEAAGRQLAPGGEVVGLVTVQLAVDAPGNPVPVLLAPKTRLEIRVAELAYSVE